MAAADAWVAQQRAHGFRIGFTCGAFDLLHAGHVDFLERARAVCDSLLVAVNSDESIRQYKNPLRPINPQQQRMEVIAGLACVDGVVLMEEQRPLRFIQRWQPDFYIKGGDYSGSGLRSASAVEAYGGKVVLLPFAWEQSTTAILEKAALLQTHDCVFLSADESQPVAFLDRDGTLIRNVPYLHDPHKVELLPGVGEGLRELQDAGFRLVIVTNQQGIGLGYFTLEDFFEVNLALFRQLAPFGVKIDKVYFCPHSFAQECDCRKPGKALIEKALQNYQVAPQDCWFIGDSKIDIETGKAAGCRTLLVSKDVSFSEAVQQILRQSARS